jgi:hypothetical protein
MKDVQFSHKSSVSVCGGTRGDIRHPAQKTKKDEDCLHSILYVLKKNFVEKK